MIYNSVHKKKVTDGSQTITPKSTTIRESITRTTKRKLSAKMIEKIEEISDRLADRTKTNSMLSGDVETITLQTDKILNELSNLWNEVVNKSLSHGQIATMNAVLDIDKRENRTRLHIVFSIDQKILACISVPTSGSIIFHAKERIMVDNQTAIAAALKKFFNGVLSGKAKKSFELPDSVKRKLGIQPDYPIEVLIR